MKTPTRWRFPDVHVLDSRYSTLPASPPRAPGPLHPHEVEDLFPCDGSRRFAAPPRSMVMRFRRDAMDLGVDSSRLLGGFFSAALIGSAIARRSAGLSVCGAGGRA